MSSRGLLPFSLFFVFALFIVSLFFSAGTWLINDDVQMALYAAGHGFVNMPTAYLGPPTVGTPNLLVGAFLKKCSLSWPSVPWYGIFTVLVHYLSAAGLLYALLRRQYSGIRILCFLLFFTVFDLLILRTPTYTMIAFLSGMSGAFLFLTALQEEKRTPFFLLSFVAGIFLLLAGLIRMQSLFFVAVLLLPVLSVVTIKNWRRSSGRVFLFIGLVSLAVASAFWYSRNAYMKDPRWEQVSEVNEALGEMVDNNRILFSPKTRPLFERAGWSLNDFLMVKNWFSADGQVFGKDRLDQLLNEFRKGEKPFFDFYMLKFWLMRMLRDEFFYMGSLLLFIFGLHLGRKTEAHVVASVFLGTVIVLYLAMFSRLPERVYLSLLAYLSFLALYSVDGPFSGRKLFGYIQKIIVAVFVAYLLFLHYSVTERQRQLTATFEEQLGQLQTMKDKVFLVWGKSLPIEYGHVFDDLRGFSGMRLVPANYHFSSPAVQDSLQEIGVKTFRDLIYSKALLHIGDDRYMALYAQYAREHYGLNLAFQVVQRNALFSLYRQVGITPDNMGSLVRQHVNVMGVAYTFFLLP